MSIESLILHATEEAQARLDELYRQTPQPASGSPLNLQWYAVTGLRLIAVSRSRGAI